MRIDANVECRGVQYVYWVMHKCIMVKVGGKVGNEKHVKYVKSRRKLWSMTKKVIRNFGG